jgi:uncharacterized BrkB/YihY/UPF0761 family membrane protein
MDAEETSAPAGEAAGLHGLKRREAALRLTISQRRTRLEEARSRSRTIDAAFVAAEHDTHVGGGVLAGAVAFRLFLLLVPLTFFLVYGIGLGASAVSESPHDLARQLGIGGLIAKAATTGAGQSDASRLAILVVAGLAMLLGAHAALKVIRVVHGLVWSVPVPKLRRSWRATGVFLLVVVVALTLSAAIGSLGGSTVLSKVATDMLFLGIAFGLWLFIAWYMPHPAGLQWTALVPGAALVAVGTAAMRLATVAWFTRSLSHKSATYGAIGGSLALLFWVYLVGRLIIGSVVLNSAMASRTDVKHALEPEAGGSGDDPIPD